MDKLSYLSGKLPNGFEINYNTIDYFLDKFTEDEGKEEAIIFYDCSLNRTSITRSQWSIDSRNFAYNLVDKTEKGEKYCLLLPNRPEFVVSFIGLQRLGINTILTPNIEVAKMIATDVKFNGFVTLNSYWKILKNRKGIKDIPNVILIQDETLEEKRGDEIAYNDLVKENERKPKLPRVQNDEDLIVTITSGSTGKPKLVQGSQRGYMNVFGNIGKTPLSAIFSGYGFSDRPMSYSAGIIFVFTFMTGMKVVTTEHPCSKENTISTKHIAQVISNENCQMALFFGYLLFDMVNSPDDLRLISKHVKFALTSGQKIVMPIVERFWDIVPQLSIIEFYATTETGMIFAKMRTKTNPNPLPRITFGTELSIRDSKGDVVDRNTTGEIWLKSFSQLKYYIQDPMKTSQTITTSGWVKIGDFAYITDDGDIIFQGKNNDQIKIATLIIFPQEIENVLNNQRCVEVSIVVDLPDNRLGSVLALIIKLKKEWIDKQDEARIEIENYFYENFKNNEEAGVLYPLGKLSFIREWPMTSSQKILRRRVRELCIIGEI